MTKDLKTQPVAMKMLTGKEAIIKAITSIMKRGKALDKDIHVAACSTLNHAELHGDITLANRLLEAMPNSARKNALRDWYTAFGKFSYDITSKAMIYDKTKTTELNKAINTPYWEFKPETAYVPFDAIEAIQNLIKRAEKAIAHGDSVPEGFIASLSSFIAQQGDSTDPLTNLAIAA